MNQPDGFDCPGCAWPEPASTRDASSSARTAPRRSPRRRRPRARRRSSSRRTTVAELRVQSDFELGQQGRLTASDGARRRARPLPADRLGRRVRADRRASCAPADPDAQRVLHVGPHEQRGRVPLPAVRPHVRHEQPPRLLEHVPRVERRRADGDGRHRQGHGVARRLRARRPDLRRRPEPGHQPPAHADDAARGREARRDDRRDQPAARGRADTRSRTRRSRSTCSAAAQLAKHFLQVQIGGDLALFHGRRARRVLERDARRDARDASRRRARSIDCSSPSTPTASTRGARTCCATPWATTRRAVAASPRRRSGAIAELYVAAKRRDRVLGDGPHAAQARGARRSRRSST